jgi:Nucleotide-diphospho-sugar transferase
MLCTGKIRRQIYSISIVVSLIFCAHRYLASWQNLNPDIHHNIRIQRQPTRFCELIHEAQVFLEQPNEPRRKMVHIFVVNYGHLPLLLNALTFIQLLPTRWKSVVLAIDDQLCPSLREKKISRNCLCIDYSPRFLEQMQQDEPQYYNEHVNKSGHEVILDKAEFWGTNMYTVYVNAKLYALRDVLHCGLDVFLTDVDIAFLKDPRPHFVGEDIIAQQNDQTEKPMGQEEINSGFMYWRRTPSNLNFSQTLVKQPPKKKRNPDDQARVNALVREKSIHVTFLPLRKFPNGASMQQHDASGNLIPLSTETVIVHANWVIHIDMKKELLSKHGLWLVD